MSTETTLNGLHPEKLEQIVEGLADEATFREVSGPWQTTVRWDGGFRAVGEARKHLIRYDEPEGLDATDESASAHEQLLSAIGACVTVGFVLNATRQGVRIDELSIDVAASFEDIRRWAGLNADGHPGYSGVTIAGRVKADADEATIRAIWQKAVDGSPVAQSVARATPLEPSLEIA